MNRNTHQKMADAISYVQRESLIERGRLLHSVAVYNALANFAGWFNKVLFQKQQPTEKHQLKYS